jgi:hypothetical protein
MSPEGAKLSRWGSLNQKQLILMYQTVFVIIDGDGNVIGVLPPTDQTADLLQQALESHHDAVDSAEVVDLKMEFEGRWTYTAKLELDGDDPREVSLTPAGFFAPQKPKATNFDIRITKDAALELLRTCDLKSGHKCLKDELGIEIMCKEYGDDEDWVGIESDDYYTIRDGEEYQTFEIWLPTIPSQKLLSAIKGIDWQMLRGQKANLVEIQAFQISQDQFNAVEGMLSLLDAIQDAAVDDGIFTSMEVFGKNFTEEEG